jgi:hypothetical protein
MKFDKLVQHILNEEEDPSDYTSGPHAKYYQEPGGSGSADTREDFEFMYQGKAYMASITYDIEEVVHPGDYDTPDHYDVDIRELEINQLWADNPETGEWVEFNKEQSPQLWDAVAKEAETAFLDNESNWNPNY